MFYKYIYGYVFYKYIYIYITCFCIEVFIYIGCMYTYTCVGVCGCVVHVCSGASFLRIKVLNHACEIII